MVGQGVLFLPPLWAWGLVLKKKKTLVGQVVSFCLLSGPGLWFGKMVGQVVCFCLLFGLGVWFWKNCGETRLLEAANRAATDAENRKQK